MMEQEEEILRQVSEVLGRDRLTGSIVYAASTPLRADERVRLGDVWLEPPWDANAVFVDLEPGANWGHACVYLAVRRDAPGVVEVPARMPPFLKPGTTRFQFLWRGAGAPEWAVVRQN